MHIVILVILLIAILILPNYWVRYVLKRHSKERNDFPGTGGELARHLLDRFNLNQVSVETTESGDHYDPTSRTVRLTPDNHDGRSLTAIAVATHEVGHAIQHGNGSALFNLRTRLAITAMMAEKAGTVAIIAVPFVAALTRSPAAGGVVMLIAVLSMALGTLVHLVTLPVEIDASFNKALPILKEGEYLNENDLPAARSILRAAAFTYVAGSMAGILNFWRWLAVLRGRV